MAAFVSSASRGNNPVKGRARSLFIPDRNYSLTKYLADADGRSKRILPSRPDCWSENFQNMQENRLPGERPDRHPAAGIWERTPPRFRRDRSRRDACPTLRPRPENNPVKGQARHLFIPDRNYCHYQISRGADGGSRRILRSRPDCWSGISEICWNIDAQVLRADRRSRRPGLGCARLRRPLRRSARSDRVAGAVRGADLAFPETAANDTVPGPRPSFAEPCFPVTPSHDLGSP